MTTRRIVLCADDFGQNAAISAGIEALAASGRISATSCMTASPHWPEAARRIAGHRGRIDLGLHFTLDAGPDDMGYRAGSLLRQIAAAYLRRLRSPDVESMIERQIDRFERYIGAMPDFVDGHQHVHQLPVVRDALLAVYERRLRRHGSYIRTTARISAPAPARIKSLVIRSLGAPALRRRLDAAGIPHNADFGGIYSFDAADYPALMRAWLERIDDGGLIMCHPGLGPADPMDPISASRASEYRYLASDRFITDCADLGVQLSRGRELGWMA